VSTRIDPSFGASIGRHIVIGMEGAIVTNTFPAQPTYGYEARIVSASVRYLLPANLVVGVTYSLWQRLSQQSPTRVTSNGSMSLSYAKTFR
jgi:hypothetical protein